MTHHSPAADTPLAPAKLELFVVTLGWNRDLGDEGHSTQKVWAPDENEATYLAGEAMSKLQNSKKTDEEHAEYADALVEDNVVRGNGPVIARLVDTLMADLQLLISGPHNQPSEHDKANLAMIRGILAAHGLT